MNHNDQAFLVMGIDITVTPPRVTALDVFSEENPTINLARFRTVVVLSAHGDSYDDGIKRLASMIRQPGNEWMIPILADRAKDSFRRAGVTFP